MTNQSQNVTLNVQTRKTGKGNSRQLRNEKLIPAVVYGSKVENTNLCLDELSVNRYSSQGFENSIFTFKSDEKTLDGLSVLMKEVNVHPVTRRPVHVDFYAVDMESTVRVNVEIKFEGKPIGVAEEGGLMQILLRDIEVECLPKDIPESLTADVSGLALNAALHISDLSLPSGVKAVSSENLALANVTASKEESSDAAAPAEGEAADAEKKD